MTALHSTFEVIDRVGDPAILVGATPDPHGRRLACVVRPTSGALVLGSRQTKDQFDTTRAATLGLATLRRRSGGGAVVVEPGAQAWIDVFIPRGDPLFSDDVRSSADWVGDCWAKALGHHLASSRLRVHKGALEETVWSQRWCFSGLGPGEVLLDRRKVVGVSQRRDRSGAWLFTMALVRLDVARDASLLGLEAEQAAEFVQHLGMRVTTVPADVGLLEAAFVEALP